MGLGGDKSAAGSSHRRDIEGLRTIAVALVMLYHFGVPGFDGGYVGVDVFFVVSGFLITSSLLHESERKGTFRLRDFYARRVRRLLPISGVVLVASAIASAIILDPSLMRNTGIDVFASGLFSSNWIFAERATDYLQGGVSPSPLQHYWSLSLEEQFYVIWPLLLLAGLSLERRLKIKVVVPGIIGLIVAGSFIVSVLTTARYPTWAYFGLHTRAWELGIGALVAVTATRVDFSRVRGAVPLSVVALFGVIISAVTYKPPIDFPGWIALLPVGATALLVISGFRSNNLAARALGNPVFHFIGARSYSLYLWHWPVIILAEARAGDSLTGVQKMLALALTLVLSEVGFRLVENPIRFSAPLVRSSFRSLSVGCIAIGAVSVSGLWVANYEKVVTSGFEAEEVSTEEGSLEVRIATLREALRLAVEARPLPDNLEPSLLEVSTGQFSTGLGTCFVEKDDASVPECMFGDPGGQTTIAVLGDSHMAQWFEVFNEMAVQNNFKLITYLHAGCSLAGIETVGLFTRNEPWCVNWLQAALEDMRNQDIEFVVMTNNFFLFDASTRKFITSEAWTSGMRKTIGNLVKMGIVPIYLGDNPQPPPSVLQCLTNNVNDISECFSPRAEATRSDYSISGRQLVVGSGGYYLDLADLMCSGAMCPAVVGNTLLYRDWSHLTEEGTKLLAPVVTGLILKFIESAQE